MSTIAQIIALVDEEKPNAFSESVKVRWIAELDGKIAVDVFLMHHSETTALCYKWPESMNTEPLVPFPHDDIYTLWLEAKIDYANGEYNKYQNTMEAYNESYGNFLRWFARAYRPAQGGGYGFEMRSDVTQYYITAYGLAVKQGYTGTLDEWLVSLIGPKGDPGVSAYEFALAGGFVGTEADFVYKLCHDGKTAWEYAVEGGYTGTETEFTALMANAASKEDIPKIDETLAQKGQAADAAAVGAALGGKAPAGYGLGNTASKHIADLSGLDALVESGFYTVVFSEGLFLSDVTDREHYVNFASVHVVAYSKENVMQQMRAIHSTSTVRRIRTSEGWSEWEWENPPMVLSTEYRTLERWQGKPVYTMLVDCGGMVNGKRVDLDVEHTSILRHSATIGGNSLPLNNYGTYVSAQHVGQTAIAILMYSGSESFQGMSIYTQIWYTKD